MELFLIRSPDGLYSLGGRCGNLKPRWGKKGKAWNSKGALKLHLRSFTLDIREKAVEGYYFTTAVSKYWLMEAYSSCNIIQIDVDNNIITESPFVSWCESNWKEFDSFQLKKVF